MSSARRPLLTATAAGTLLCALWFVPSANASQSGSAGAAAQPAPAARASAAAQVSSARVSAAQVLATRADRRAAAVSEPATMDSVVTTGGTRLADTGSFDTTPYVVGGSAFLTVGAGFVVHSVRRERHGF